MIINCDQQPAAPPSADGHAGGAWHAPAPVTTSIGAESTSVPETVRSPAPLQPQQQQQPALASSPLPPIQTSAQQPQFPPGVKLDMGRPPSALQQQQQQPQPHQQTAQRNAFPGSLSDLVASFETVKQKGEQFSINRWCSEVALTCACTRAPPGNSGTPHDELGPGTQVTRWRVFKHAAATGHGETQVLCTTQSVPVADVLPAVNELDLELSAALCAARRRDAILCVLFLTGHVPTVSNR